MSASLVGSEMCIRDSDCAQYSIRCTTAKKPRGLEGADRLVAKRLEIRAVSYTHLTLPTICSV
eukprot:15377846-Alexandrium_andersonii.AAC.1